MPGIFDFLKRKPKAKSKPESEPISVPSWDEIIKKVSDYKRTAWVPVVENGAAAAAGSKFGGIPLIGHDEEWPVCPNCHKPMQLFAQVNSTELPPEAREPFGPGILQVFYCTTSEPLCEYDCRAYFHFSASVLVRIQNPAKAPRDISISPVEEAFPEKRVVGWKAFDDYPGYEELDMMGLSLTDVEVEELSEEYPLNGDKLWGWPNWLQSVNYPICPECGDQMEAILQIDSEVNIPHMFGDSGCSHIYQCPRHPNQLTMGWDCY